MSPNLTQRSLVSLVVGPLFEDCLVNVPDQCSQVEDPLVEGCLVEGPRTHFKDGQKLQLVVLGYSLF